MVVGVVFGGTVVGGGATVVGGAVVTGGAVVAGPFVGAGPGLVDGGAAAGGAVPVVGPGATGPGTVVGSEPLEIGAAVVSVVVDEVLGGGAAPGLVTVVPSAAVVAGRGRTGNASTAMTTSRGAGVAVAVKLGAASIITPARLSVHEIARPPTETRAVQAACDRRRLARRPRRAPAVRLRSMHRLLACLPAP